MARMKVTHDANDPAERVADAAMAAAEAQAQAEGTTLKEAVVMIRLGTDEAATAGHREDGDADGEWLATELYYRFELIMKAMGKSVHLVPYDEPGQG